MTRRLPPPWHADKFSGGYVVRDANGFAVAYVGRSTEAEAIEAKQMTDSSLSASFFAGKVRAN